MFLPIMRPRAPIRRGALLLRPVGAAWLIAIVCVVGSLLLPPVTAAATTATCSEGGAHNRWQGTRDYTSGVQVHGAFAKVENQVLKQCNLWFGDLLEVSGSWIWDAVGPYSGHGNDIIQVGVGVCRAPGFDCFETMRYFFAWGRSHLTTGCAGYSDVAPTPQDYGAWGAASHFLEIRHSGNWWNVAIDYQTRVQIVESAICWTPQQAEWFAETWDYGDATGGSTANPYTMNQLAETNSENGGWSNPLLSGSCVYYAGTPFRCSITSSTSMNIWTQER